MVSCCAIAPGEAVGWPTAGRGLCSSACSFWLADTLWILQGRKREARALFERLLGLCSDVGLMAEGMIRARAGSWAISHRRSRIWR